MSPSLAIFLRELRSEVLLIERLIFGLGKRVRPSPREMVQLLTDALGRGAFAPDLYGGLVAFAQATAPKLKS